VAAAALQGGFAMAICEVFGNDYDKFFELVTGDERHAFDSVT
jgi:hypothetical protein